MLLFLVHKTWNSREVLILFNILNRNSQFFAVILLYQFHFHFRGDKRIYYRRENERCKKKSRRSKLLGMRLFRFIFCIVTIRQRSKSHVRNLSWRYMKIPIWQCAGWSSGKLETGYLLFYVAYNVLYWDAKLVERFALWKKVCALNCKI